MKPLQNYIEEIEKKFDEKFRSLKETDAHYYNPYLLDIKDFLSQSLHRIAKITAEEIVPEKKEKTKFQNDMYDALDDGYNQAISDLQTKIKEFGI